MPIPGSAINGFRSTSMHLGNGFARNGFVGGAAKATHGAIRGGKAAADVVTGTGRDIAGAAKGTHNLAQGYRHTLNKVMKVNDDGKIGQARMIGGAAMVGAPIALAASAVAGAGTPDYRPRHDYGNWVNQNAMTGAVDIAEMGSYDVDRATESARRMNLIKKSGWEDGCVWPCELEKTAGVVDAVARWGVKGANRFRVFKQVVKDPKAFGHQPKAFFDSKKNMLGVGLVAGAFGAAGEYGASRRVSKQNLNTYMNLLSQVPQL